MHDTLLRSLLLGMAVCSTVSAPSSQAHKLSGALAQRPNQGHASNDFVVAPDGQRVVFKGDIERSGVTELWSAPVDHSAPAIKLSGNMVWGGDVLAATPVVTAANLVVYAADAFENDHAGLYVVPIDGSAPPIELFRGCCSLRTFYFRVSVDGSRVLFLSGSELLVVPIDGSSPPLAIVPSAGLFEVSPDGQRVVAWDGNALWSAPIDGSLAPVMIGDVAAIEGQLWLEFSPDGQRLVYRGYWDDGFSPPIFELGVAWTDGSAPAVVLSNSIINAPEAWQLARDGTKILVAQGLELSMRSTITGSSVPLWFLPSGQVYDWVALTPNEGWALYKYSSNLARVRTNGAFVDFVIPGSWGSGDADIQFTSDGSRAVLSHAAGISALDISWTTPPVTLFSNPGRALILPGDQEVLMGVSSGRELNLRRLDASSPAQQIHSLQVGGNISDFSLAGNGTNAVWHQTDGGKGQIFARPLDLSAPAQAFHDNPSGAVGNVTSFVTGDDGRVVLYRADIEVDNRFELVAVEPFSRRGPRRLNPTLTSGRNVERFVLSPDGVSAAFWIRGGASDLWVTRTNGSLPPVRLAATSLTWSDALTFTLDGQRVLYGTPATGLSSRPANASSPAVTLVPGLATREVLLAQDGVHALAYGSINGSTALYRITVDGSAPGVQLALLPSYIEIHDLVFVGTDVYYRAGANGVFEIFRVPFDGSGAPTLVSPSLVIGGSVTDLKAQGGVIVFRADATLNERFELYRLTGIGTSVPLTPIWNVGDVQPDFVLTASGDQVVFRANPEEVGRTDLLRAPTDGSAAPTFLVRAPSSLNDVLHFALDEKSGQIVHGLLSSTSRFDLWAVSLTGGPSRQLDEEVVEYRLTPDSRVVWTASTSYNAPMKLLATRLAGGPTECLADIPLGYGQIHSFLPTLDNRVFFIAKADDERAEELFLSVTGAAKRPSGGAPGDGGTVVR